MNERQDKAETHAPRKRALVSCDRCKLRRTRCIRANPDEPCADCKLSGLQCESKLPRKQRVYGSVETLSLRYRALESLVKGLFPQENVQDLNTIFRIAAAQNIPMPANDDYTPADIFHDSSQQLPTSGSTQQHQHQDYRQSTLHKDTQPNQPRHGKFQSSPHAGSNVPVSASNESQHNPFQEVQQPVQQHEELIPTRHGASHYFGPSSSFRLATTIRALIARCKDAHQTEVSASRSSGSSRSDPSSRALPSLRPTSTNPSDEEYIIPNVQGQQSSRSGSKRSRSQMETTNDQWEKKRRNSRPDTIADLLPSRPLSDALVSAYFDHMHILVPLYLRSMFQLKLEATYSRQAEALDDCRDIGWLICLAMVLSFGCQQLHEHDPFEAHALQLKYLSFVKTYFRKLLTTTSLSNIQALVLLSMHYHYTGQKSTSWLFIGLGARMAITMGMHRDGTNMEFDPIERNTRRQVWWSIYTFERVLCSVLGRPSVIDDGEVIMRSPDAPMLEWKGPSVDIMSCISRLTKLSYSIRQRAYFDPNTAEERSPTLIVASTLLRECDNFYSTIPRHLSAGYTHVPIDQRARILLLHIHYHYTRCVVSRDFLIQKVERNVSYLEDRSPPLSDNWEMTLALSEDCVESAHQSLQCMVAISALGTIGHSSLDLFLVFHSVMLACADFLARPTEQRDSQRDIERKAMVRAMLEYVRGMKKLAPTYNILSRIAIRFASITGVCEEPTMPDQALDQSLQSSPPGDDENMITDIQEDWFATATTNLALDFFDLSQNVGQGPSPGLAADPVYTRYTNPAREVDDWTTKALNGMHNI
ncbi:hypothetical protein CC86DRAFT_328703 [Ophiobolus disseminans]|uniref:Zn(2)-C6 fungal-type domain-containing protein n=1 Tax=Ophiobolus disseminans TaxID=1469910 RepID=A0A6A6ZRK9_9PLEO|nr:hypothetical protein CC86DRAFT_328703 [Ophiobolus disseminans]